MGAMKRFAEDLTEQVLDIAVGDEFRLRDELYEAAFEFVCTGICSPDYEHLLLSKPVLELLKAKGVANG